MSETLETGEAVETETEALPESGLHMTWLLHLTMGEARALRRFLSGPVVMSREEREARQYRALRLLFGKDLASFVERARVRFVVRRDVPVIPSPAHGVRRLAPEWLN